MLQLWNKAHVDTQWYIATRLLIAVVCVGYYLWIPLYAPWLLAIMMAMLPPKKTIPQWPLLTRDGDYVVLALVTLALAIWADIIKVPEMKMLCPAFVGVLAITSAGNLIDWGLGKLFQCIEGGFRRMTAKA